MDGHLKNLNINDRKGGQYRWEELIELKEKILQILCEKLKG
jgi:hypothetical protein